MSVRQKQMISNIYSCDAVILKFRERVFISEVTRPLNQMKQKIRVRLLCVICGFSAAPVVVLKCFMPEHDKHVNLQNKYLNLLQIFLKHAHYYHSYSPGRPHHLISLL